MRRAALVGAGIVVGVASVTVLPVLAGRALRHLFLGLDELERQVRAARMVS